MSQTNFQKLDVYKLAEKLADKIWNIVIKWDALAKDTVGKQIIEGDGRGSYQDHRRFIKIARGSLYETKHWLRRAYTRQLLTTTQVEILKPIIDELSPRLNAYLKSIGNTSEKN